MIILNILNEPTFPIHRSHTNLRLMCLFISCDIKLTFIFNLFTSKYLEVTPQLLQNGSHFKMLHVQFVRLTWAGSPNLHPWAQIDNYYSDVIMGVMASQITSLTIVCSTVYSGEDQRKHQSSASPVTRKMFPFDDAIMESLSVICILICVIFLLW